MYFVWGLLSLALNRLKGMVGGDRRLESLVLDEIVGGVLRSGLEQLVEPNPDVPAGVSAEAVAAGGISPWRIDNQSLTGTAAFLLTQDIVRG